MMTPLTVYADAHNQFVRGTKAFRSDDYQQAARHYEQARREGMDTAALHYNLGVSYYKLREYEKAERSFKHTLNYPDMSALGYYNLGLISLKQNKPEQARTRFHNALNASRDDKVTRLARAQLNALQPGARKPARRSSSPTKSARNWTGYASLGGGYDDNVSNTATNRNSAIDDTLIEFFGLVNGTLTGTRTDGISLNASIYALEYSDFDTNDFNQATLMLRKNKKFGKWRTYAGGFTKYSTLNSDSYQSEYGAEIAGRRKLTKNTSVRLRYRFHYIKSLKSSFNYLEGFRNDFRVDHITRMGKNKLKLRYLLELDDRDDLPTESYSPTRNTVRAVLSRDFTRHWNAGIDIAYRNADYPRVGNFRRTDDRVRTQAFVKRKIAKKWEIQGKYRFTSTNSTDPTRSADSNRVMLSVSRVFN